MYRRTKPRQPTVKGTERKAIMNAQAARVIKHFCLATGKSESEIKRRYNTVPATRRHIILNFLQRTTEEFKQKRQEQMDAAKMAALYTAQGRPAA